LEGGYKIKGADIKRADLKKGGLEKNWGVIFRGLMEKMKRADMLKNKRAE
jgi:hypothetical protein